MAEPLRPAAAPDAGLPLCDSRALEEAGRAHVWDVLEHGRPARAFVLRFEGGLRGYMNRCLHVPTEMDWQPGEFLDSDKRWILCAIHGAHYDPRNGRCAGGPCGRGTLTAVDVAEHGGQVRWYPSRDIRPVPPSEPSASPASLASPAPP
jgi:nitrite reductase/ring-hydroxylating ferredoxin subunit